MSMTHKSYLRPLAASLLGTALFIAAPASAQQVKADEIGGVVTGAKGPEAGVWVIAETKDLPTKFVKIVVTDDSGRFLIPGLPKANYDVWVRGYGLVDSPKTKSAIGKSVALKSVAAPNEAAAAEYYPAIYWYSMVNIPAANLFPGTGPSGNGMPITLKDQGMWLRYMKTDSCNSCHQLGDKATRTLPTALGHFNTSAEAWERRIQSGQASPLMVNGIGNFDTARALANFGNWTDRVGKGELPFMKPNRPAGIERNVIVTEWDWSTPQTYLHDEIATDRRNPTLNPHGLIYGSPQTGRVWLTAKIRPANSEPAFCKAGSNHPSAKAFPLARSGRQLEVYDPKTKKATPIDLCFSTHHLQLDKNDVLWFSSGNTNDDVVGWFDVKKWDATHDEAASQGWAPFIVDANGNGKVDDYVGPNDPVDPKKDKHVKVGFYGASPNPADGTVWASYLGFPGGAARFDPKTKLTEYYEIPWNDPKNPDSGFSPRGMDIDSNGIAWLALASGHMASFDRKLCKGPLNGPLAATGAPNPHITTGSTSSIRLGSARTFRSRPATIPTRCSRWWMRNGSRCACHIPWASSRRTWTGASTTQTPVGRARAYSRPIRAVPRRISKAARARPARSCISRSGPTRWRIEP